MPRNPFSCKTIIRCRNCGHESRVCVRLTRGVPETLQCDHDHYGGGGGGLRCEGCRALWPITVAQLVALVEDLLPRRVREWLLAGAVVVTFR